MVKDIVAEAEWKYQYTVDFEP